MDEENLSKIRGLLLDAWNDARKFMNNPDIQNRVCYTFTTEGDEAFVVGIQGIDALNQVTKMLSDDKVIGRRISYHLLRRDVDNLFLSLVYTNPQEIAKETTRLIAKMIEKLEKLQSLSWKVMIPITNLTLDIPYIEIGNVSFVKTDSDIFKKMIADVENRISHSHSTDEVKDYLVSSLKDRYQNHVMAISRITAVESEHAREMGKLETELALDVLRFYTVSATNKDPINYRMYIGRKGNIFNGQSAVTYLTDTISSGESNTVHMSIENTGYLFPYTLDRIALANMNNLEFHKLCNILRKAHEERSDFEKLIVIAIQFYGSAINESLITNSFIKFVICLDPSC